MSKSECPVCKDPVTLESLQAAIDNQTKKRSIITEKIELKNDMQ